MASRTPHFTPPCCPNPKCNSHASPDTWRFIKKGFYRRDLRPQRIQRYACTRCARRFSSQTFSTTYWLKRPDLQRPLLLRILACSSLRQISHEFGVRHATVQRHVERLGRHCLLLHESLRGKQPPQEPLVLDGFRTLESGHYWPFDLNLLVGQSHFVYGFSDAELRRSGSMRASQKRKRKALESRYGRPDPQATRKSVKELVGRLVPAGAPVEIHSDEHRAYGWAFKRLRDRRIVHATTSSKELRTPTNPLFPVNLADLLRHTGANHKRETIAFSKRRQGALYRAAIFTVWRNYMKSVSEKRRDEPPGVTLGLIGKRMTPQAVLSRRILPWTLELGGWLERCYYGRIRTRRLGDRCREHRLEYAA